MHPPLHNCAVGSAQRQRGVALIVGLVILVMLALMGTAAYSVATQEERMAGNARDHARAFEAAEYALRQCEKVVLTGPVFDPTGTVTPGMYTAPNTGIWIGDDTTLASWNPYTYPAGSPALVNVKKGPLCIAETFDPRTNLIPGRIGNLMPHVARVTAAGFGMTDGTKVMLASYVNFFTTN